MALCGSVSLLLAAVPSAGKWKLNHDQSKLTTGEVAKEETIVIEDQGDSAKRTGDNTRDTVYTKNGKKVGTSHAVTSKDGKTMTVGVTGVDSAGKPCNGKIVFDKQQ